MTARKWATLTSTWCECGHSALNHHNTKGLDECTLCIHGECKMFTSATCAYCTKPSSGPRRNIGGKMQYTCGDMKCALALERAEADMHAQTCTVAEVSSRTVHDAIRLSRALEEALTVLEMDATEIPNQLATKLLKAATEANAWADTVLGNYAKAGQLVREKRKAKQISHKNQNRRTNRK